MSTECKVHTCHEDALEGTRYLGMCEKHFVTRPDGRPKCKVCRARYAIQPWGDAMCEFCHPAERELDPHDAQVMAALHRGEKPVLHLPGQGLSEQAAIGLARKKATKQMRVRRSMEKAGITTDYLMDRLKGNIEATKEVRNANGDLIAEVPDVRGSNQALDMSFKLLGAYPGKQRPEQKPQEVRVAVAMLPAEQLHDPTERVYTLPAKSQSSEEDEG